MSSIGPVVSEEKMFENVDGRRTDAGVTGILLAHQWAFGSGELKNKVWYYMRIVSQQTILMKYHALFVILKSGKI